MALTIEGGINIEGGISITAQPYQFTTSVSYSDQQTLRTDYASPATIQITSTDYSGILYCSSQTKRFGPSPPRPHMYGTLYIDSENPINLSSGSANVVVYANEIPELNTGLSGSNGTLNLNFSETENGPIVKTQSVAVTIWVQP